MVLDTQALVWWVHGTGLSAAATAAINDEQPSRELLVSSITAWEIAMLVSRGRLLLSLEVDAWLLALVRSSAVRFVPIDNDIATAAANLPGQLHRDPADRFVIATARHFAAPLVTSDQKIRLYPHVRTIW